MSKESGDTQNEKVVEYIEVPGKDGEMERFDKEKIMNIQKFRAETTRKTQEAAPILEALQRYNIDADTFLRNAEGSMELVGDLMDQGVLDKEGKVVMNRGNNRGETTDDRYSQSDQFMDTQETQRNVPPNEDVNSLKAQIEGLTAVVNTLQRDSASLMTSHFANKITQAHPEFQEDDVKTVLNISFKDKSKSYMDHAKDLADKKLKDLGAIEEAVAKKYGVNLEEWNKKQQMSAEGGPSAMFKSKKVKFDPDPKDPDQVSTVEAVTALFEASEEK